MIDLSKSGDLWTLTINRPEKANSLTKNMLCEIRDIATQAKDAKALIITGTGKVFSAGADLEEAHAGLATDGIWEQASGAIANAPCMTIAALNGTLAGGAFGMALACDLRITVPNANFFYPVMKLGFLPQPSDPIRMAKLIGPARTKMILMAGQKISASQAYDYGLVDKIIDATDLMQTATDLCQTALGANPSHIQAIKKMCSSA